jgi:membrane protein YqaA with SNARE-associated domain
LRKILVVVFSHLVGLGGIGLVLLGVLDSSFLVMPLGNDLLVIVLTARHHTLMPYYAAMATAGSVLGCLIIDVISRKGEEALLEKHVSGRRLDYVRKKIEKGAGWALTFAALMPPPFPFTPFVIAAAASEYPRKKLLGILTAARFVRFAIDGTLALLFGRRILRIGRTPAFEIAVFVLIGISILASVLSVYTWVRRSKQARN